MITNKDISIENGNIILNGDKYPLDGQSPETIMGIVEDNSDTTPTENSTAPITSGGVYTTLGTVNTALSGKADIYTAASGGAKQTITIGTLGTENHAYLLSAGYWTQNNDNYVFGLVLINSSNNVKFVSLAPASSIMTVSVAYADGDITLTFGSDPYSKAQLIKLH